MKILGVYGSEYGQAEAVLKRISKVLERHGHSVTIVKGNAVPPGLSVEDFDAVVIAASIIVGNYQRYIREFVTRHRGALSSRLTAFVSVNGASPESMPAWRAAADRYVAGFLKQTEWTPSLTAAFAGALRYPRYGLVTRWIMKLISRSTGGPTDTSREYEFTDWEEVERFGGRLAEAIAAAPSPRAA